MIFWNWFKVNGDKVFTFLSLASLGLQGLTDLSPVVLKGALVAGVLATAAHQSFFPNQPNGVPSK